MYSLFYDDIQLADGSLETRRVRRFIGNLESMSERAARREHERIMHQINSKRGSVAPAPINAPRTFNDAVKAWLKDVGPHLSPSTVRQRESYLRAHVLPRFKDVRPHSMDLPTLQGFATDLRKRLSRKTTINIMSAVFVILDYARKSGTPVANVAFGDIELGENTSPPEPPYFTREQVAIIIAIAPEPYKTIFATAWFTGLRSGELLALRVDDLDFERLTIRVNKSADDHTRTINQTKTKKSTATLPIPASLVPFLMDYLQNHWKANTPNLLFPNREGTRPMRRESIVVFGLKPILKKLGLPTHNVGLHAFRHGLATELIENGVPLTVLQAQLRHADVKTTLRVYSHNIPASHREAMDKLSIGTQVPFGTQNTGEVLLN